ncbi:MAG: hypothetical protein KGI02_06110 [Thaumarchaeota archaeon]|nr:hypothetical protein [Nitrososphaerota archaeon]MDE1831932.1 hypothetical protein [Nitrososphaerota archaeon]
MELAENIQRSSQELRKKLKTTKVSGKIAQGRKERVFQMHDNLVLVQIILHPACRA